MEKNESVIDLNNVLKDEKDIFSEKVLRQLHPHRRLKMEIGEEGAKHKMETVHKLSEMELQDMKSSLW